jgi:hypothetical protein
MSPCWVRAGGRRSLSQVIQKSSSNASPHAIVGLASRLPKRLKLAPLGARPSRIFDNVQTGGKVEHEIKQTLTNRDPFHVPRHLTIHHVAHGLISTPTRLELHLSFERFPIWLLTRESVLVSSVTIGGFSLLSELKAARAESNWDLLEGALDNIGRSAISFPRNGSPSPTALVLASGSLTYVKAWPAEAANPTLVLCDEHVQSKRMFSQLGLRWMRLRHETFGGVTHFQAMLGTNLPNFEPVRTELRRGLHHVLDYGIKPNWSSNGDNAESLGLDNWLHPDDLG